MEEKLNIYPIDIVINAKDGHVNFEIKDPKALHKNLQKDLDSLYSDIEPNSVVIFPENKIIESQRIFVEGTSLLI